MSSENVLPRCPTCNEVEGCCQCGPPESGICPRCGDMKFSTEPVCGKCAMTDAPGADALTAKVHEIIVSHRSDVAAERIAELVASEVAAAAQREREACAQLCHDYARAVQSGRMRDDPPLLDSLLLGRVDGAMDCRRAIRQRGEAPR